LDGKTSNKYRVSNKCHDYEDCVLINGEVQWGLTKKSQDAGTDTGTVVQWPSIPAPCYNVLASY